MLYILFWVLYGYQLYTAWVLVFEEQRQPERTLGWLVVLVFIPLIGLGLFIAFGERMRAGRHHFKVAIRAHAHVDKVVQPIDRKKIGELVKEETSEIEDINVSGVMEMMKLLENNNHALLYPYNKIELLSEPKQTFDSLWKDLEDAKDHIHVEFFIIDDDSTGRKLKEILCKKAKEGLRVRVIYDYWGSKLGKQFLKEMEDSGVRSHAFFPPKFPFFLRHVNNRNHRKIVVIDGKIGYTGGLNIADRYRIGNNLGAWRDTMMRIEGSAVEGLQETFLSDWFFIEHKPHLKSRYFPEAICYEDRKNMVQIVDSGPDTKYRAILQGVMMMVSNARRYVYIQSPYFMPPSELLEVLLIAAMRGVQVKVLVPEASDTSMAQAGNASYVEPMLEAGVEMYWYEGGFLHSKAIVVDDYLSTVGTSNMDFRSYEQNFEVNAFIYDCTTARQLKENFERDLAYSKKLELVSWRKRSKKLKFMEGISRLFSPAM